MVPNVLLLDQDVVVGGYEKKQNGETRRPHLY